MNAGAMSLLVVLCCAAAVSEASAAEGCDRALSYDRSDVAVSVTFNDGWNPPVVATLNCRGELKLVGYYSSKTVTAAVDPDTAVAYVAALLAMDFFGQQERFGTQRIIMSPCSSDSVTVYVEGTEDDGVDEVSIVLGPRHHTVKLCNPAYGAPEWLHAFVRRFRTLVKAHWAMY